MFGFLQISASSGLVIGSVAMAIVNLFLSRVLTASSFFSVHRFNNYFDFCIFWICLESQWESVAIAVVNLFLSSVLGLCRWFQVYIVSIDILISAFGESVAIAIVMFFFTSSEGVVIF